MAAEDPSAGERLCRRGLLPSGEPVQAAREAGAVLQGAHAACVNCHRRSGLGSIERPISIAPIAGPYLFTARGNGARSPRPDRLLPPRLALAPWQRFPSKGGYMVRFSDPHGTK